MPLDWEGEHSAVLAEAMKIFKDKSQVRGQMWLDWPPSDKVRELRERVMRIEVAYEQRALLVPPEPGPERPQGMLDQVIVEDALDVINYAAFLIKQIRRGMSG